MSRKYVNSPNFLCVCGEFTLIVKKAYELHFGSKVGDQNKTWALHSCCSRCSRYLRCWLIGMHQSVRFAVPVVWWKQKDHLSDCYFLTKIDGHNSKSKHAIIYPNIPSAVRRFLTKILNHLSNGPCIKKTNQHLSRRQTWTFKFQCGSWFPGTNRSLISQSELNDLVRDFSLSKIQPELFASSLQGLNLLQHGFYKEPHSQRQHSLSSFLLKTANKCTIIM